MFWLWDLTLGRDVGVLNSLMLNGASRSNFLWMRDLDCEVLSGQDHIHQDNSNAMLADGLDTSVSLDFSRYFLSNLGSQESSLQNIGTTVL